MTQNLLFLDDLPIYLEKLYVVYTKDNLIVLYNNGPTTVGSQTSIDHTIHTLLRLTITFSQQGQSRGHLWVISTPQWPIHDPAPPKGRSSQGHITIYRTPPPQGNVLYIAHTHSYQSLFSNKSIHLELPHGEATK